MSRNTTVTDDKELMEMIKQDMQQQPTTANTPEPDRMEQAQKNIFSDVWGDIRPFAKEQKSSGFPIGLLPLYLGEYVEAVGKCLCIYPEMGILPLFSTLSAAVQKKAKIELYTGTAIEPLNLYCLTVAPPSQRKSPCSSLFTDVISQWEQQYNADPQHTADISGYRAEKAILESNLRKAIQKGDLTAAKQYQFDLDRLEPKYRVQLITNDATPESLIDIMAKQGEKTAIIDSEGTILDILSGMYSAVPNLSLFLKGYGGERVDVSRKGKETTVLYEPALTIGIFSQDGHFHKVIHNERFKERGLLQRFLYAFPQDNFTDMQAMGTPIPERVRNNYYETITRLLDWQPANSIILQFSEAAKQEFQEYFNNLKASAMPDMPYSEDLAKEWTMKQLTRIQRIAALLHLSIDTSNPTITQKEAHNAILMSHWLEEQAAIAFGISGTTREEKTEKQVVLILKDFLRRGRTEISKSELLPKAQKRGINAKQLTSALQVLDDDHNMVKYQILEPIGRGRKKEIIKINPKLQEYN